MKPEKINVKTRCDMHLCPNVAAYRIAAEGHPRLFGGAGLYLCKDCLKKLYEAIGKEVVPKSPDNLIKKAVKRRESND